ncbi:NmrA family NAD(P)-binding protein [Mycobacterium paraterrae]|uniref:NmrA family NAD(P)-binding protein n=1 Tax=Mycobacterium paraterrae TaxID=577492 RepID=A0ABY3VNK8_9MYCO|nr:NmrA family NAD(P)-binding protein [Mycobacterium paraterrae]UMB71006.1 NmrA family NAD(P)-binding protein [Mycobacterium paraterrae]
MSSVDQDGLVVVVGAAGRHGGTGGQVAKRALAAGRQVRALVRSDDERAQRLRRQGVETVVGDLLDLRTLYPALEGADAVYVAYPAAPGLPAALLNVASVLKDMRATSRVIVMSMGAADRNSPSGIARAHAEAEELLIELGTNVTVVRSSAFFYENILRLHAGSINLMNVLLNNFGDSRPAWIAGRDIGDYCASVLLDPDRYATDPIIYPPGHELLAHSEIADIISEEVGRPISYRYISTAEWAGQMNGLVPEATVEHLTKMGEMCENGTTLLRTDVNPAALQAASGGRAPQTFRDFVHQHSAEFGAITATA